MRHRAACKPAAVGVSEQMGDRAFADAARRRVDHAEEGHVVARVVQQVQVREHVLDFFALVELDAVDHLVGNAVLAERVLQPAREGVHAIEDGEVTRAAAAGGDLAGDVGGDPLGLGLLVGLREEGDGLAFVVFGEELFFLALGVVLDEVVGDAEDALGAAVVLLEADDLDRWESPFRIRGCC